MGLEQLVTEFLAFHKSESSIKTHDHYRDSLKLFMRCLADSQIEPTVEALTNATMNTFAAWLRVTPTMKPWRGTTERSIYGVHGALVDAKVFVRWLEEQERIDRAPKVPVPRLPQRLFPVLSEADLALVFACNQVAGKTEVAVRNRAIIAFMLDTGIRLSEVSNLTVPDIDLKDRSARIRGKGDKERMVYFSAGVAEALRRWLTVGEHVEGSLFWLTPEGIRMLFKRIQNETGLKVFTAHQVRHTSLTMLVKQNVDLHTIKRIAGHASVTTTEAYLALAGDDIKTKHNAASPFDRINSQIEPEKIGRRRLKSA